VASYEDLARSSADKNIAKTAAARAAALRKEHPGATGTAAQEAQPEPAPAGDGQQGTPPKKGRGKKKPKAAAPNGMGEDQAASASPIGAAGARDAPSGRRTK
jgi:hypothetical protein